MQQRLDAANNSFGVHLDQQLNLVLIGDKTALLGRRRSLHIDAELADYIAEALAGLRIDE